jgi:hypothetical protein
VLPTQPQSHTGAHLDARAAAGVEAHRWGSAWACTVHGRRSRALVYNEFVVQLHAAHPHAAALEGGLRAAAPRPAVTCHARAPHSCADGLVVVWRSSRVDSSPVHAPASPDVQVCVHYSLPVGMLKRVKIDAAIRMVHADARWSDAPTWCHHRCTRKATEGRKARSSTSRTAHPARVIWAAGVRPPRPPR